MKKLLIFSLALLAPGLLAGQSAAAPGTGATGGLDPAAILKPLRNDWPTYSGDYSGKRYSQLNLVNRSNVGQLSLAWVTRLQAGTGANGSGGMATGFSLPGRGGGGGAYPTIVGGLGTGALNNGNARFSGSVLEVNGILYLSSPDNAWAVDARDGTILWHYYWKTRGGTHTGNRGMAMWHNYLYFEVHDDFLISLDAATGKERWHVPIASFKEQYFSSAAPVVIGDHVIAGTGDDLGEPGFIESFDPVTGKRQWIHYNVPMKPGDPGLDTWPSLYAARHGGGTAWVPGAYDPETHLYVFGTGNSIPGYTGNSRPGNNLYTCSLVALNVDTGKMAWYYQTSPHDTHDWDSTETPIMVDGSFNGKPRKLLLQASRNGYFFVLDRVTGEHLLTMKFGTTNNWAQGLTATGAPKTNPEKDATIPGSLVNSSVTNYPPPSFSPQTGLFYVPESNSLGISYLIDDSPQGSMGLGGTAGGARFSYPANIDAIDYQKGKIVWRHQVAGSRGILTTAGHLLFSGDGQYLIALDAASGKTLWHAKVGAVGNGPETYLLDGQQYVLTIGGDQMFAFVLNSPTAGSSRR